MFLAQKTRTHASAVRLFGLLAALVPAFTATGAEPRRQPPAALALDVIGGVSSSQILIQLKPTAQQRVAGRRPPHVRRLDFDALPHLGQRTRTAARAWGAGRIRPLYTEEFSRPDLAAKYGLDRAYVVELPQATDTPAMVRAFNALGDDIESAAHDVIGGVSGEFIPSDTSFPVQWGMRNIGQAANGRIGEEDKDIDATEAWDIYTGVEGDVILAIIDSGLKTHIDIGTNMGPFPNGRIVQGRNTYSLQNPTLTTDECGHGTHVTGIAAATGDNATGVAGVNWGVKIMPIRILGAPVSAPPCGPGTVSSLVNGITWAADNGADIANFSLQYYLTMENDRRTVQNAVDYAAEIGMVMISATGNQVGAEVAFPGKSRRTLAIGGTDQFDLRATQATGAGFISNYGPEIDLMAPGDRVYSTCNSQPLCGINTYGYLSGTSMATPHVAGLASLLKAYSPSLTTHDVMDLLIIGAEDLGPENWDIEYGYGRINAWYSLVAAGNWPAMTGSYPANYAIDAGQPTDSLLLNIFGYQSLEFDLPPEQVAAIGDASFRLLQKGGSPLARPVIAGVEPLDADTVAVHFDVPVVPLTWTTVIYERGDVPSGTYAAASVTLGFLPGDVDASMVSDAEDAAALAAVLEESMIGDEEGNGVPITLPLWSGDIDRSSAITPVDLLTLIDLLNGADAFQPYLNKSLP